ncbi:16S rRNA (uracil(1498)-N(3))-methyltransferase [Thiohalobacter thiocyanaticus]|uniref:Ribosomal RNA small subunit methyltransferase E n=1 Tax=Thiohalobacter thiocyanaticus TaxID=585455 RepID=A0A426QKC8_9GAMM|nr:16S rRNA (uracil(1498)-N(3))-methyltransferase [Thiohalobacter thiocyanaticus]RRQ22209.1 16S rRNA (uracil(1498)-N(3))-methyltransferase [Thiohalobacter thiocyanaticus]
MPTPRIYLPQPLTSGSTVQLDPRAQRHAVKVLRLQVGDSLILFNGEGGEYCATLEDTRREGAQVSIREFIDQKRESPLDIALLQGIARGEKMDLILQKAVELGVSRVVPLATERSQVKLSGERLNKRMQHWRGVIIHACEQCGRNRLPELADMQNLSAALAAHTPDRLGLLLDPTAERGPHDLAATRALSLLIGPEGGLSASERGQARNAGFQGVRLGPRILRTETAGLAALAALQCLYGDLT